MTTSITRDKRDETLKSVQNAIALTFLLGLTWVFGLLALIHEDSSIIFQYFFCIFNSLQGMFIFVMFCVRQKDVVNRWKEWFFCSKFCEKKDRMNGDHRPSDKSEDLSKSTPTSTVLLQSSTSDSGVGKEHKSRV